MYSSVIGQRLLAKAMAYCNTAWVRGKLMLSSFRNHLNFLSSENGRRAMVIWTTHVQPYRCQYDGSKRVNQQLAQLLHICSLMQTLNFIYHKLMHMEPDIKIEKNACTCTAIITSNNLHFTPNWEKFSSQNPIWHTTGTTISYMFFKRTWNGWHNIC